LFQIDLSWFQVDPWLIALVIIVTIALTVFVVWLSIRAHRHQALAGREELIGKTAEVLTVMEPKGTVFIQGERWTAISESDRIEPGEEVIITKVNGLKMWVIRKQ
jgi:membrane-bound ClpP family serine protease